MDANDYYLQQYEGKAERDIKLIEVLNKNAINIYTEWVKDGAPDTEILAGLYELDDRGIKVLQQALQNNNYEQAGKVILSTIKKSLMHAAMITADESQRSDLD